MSVPYPHIHFTYEDYKSLPESMEKRYELLDGELKMVPAPTTTHQFIVRNLEFILHAFVLERALGTILAAPVDVVFGEGDAREVAQPDILYISRKRIHIIMEAEIQGAPDLVVEVLSPGTEARDRGYKRHLYGRYGVCEYWIVDPEARTVEVCRLVGTAFEVVHHYGAEDTLYCELFPGLAISLQDVFWVR